MQKFAPQCSEASVDTGVRASLKPSHPPEGLKLLGFENDSHDEFE
jgi:hypothetical protein